MFVSELKKISIFVIPDLFPGNIQANDGFTCMCVVHPDT